MNLISTIKFGKNKTCGTCTKCCEGWLTFTVDSTRIYPGNPCIFLKQNNGCTRYDTRPNYPCKTFNCVWLDIKNIPDKWKPENCGVIMKFNAIHDIKYVEFIQAPSLPSKEMIDWAKNYFKKNKINFLYVNENGVHPYGEKIFIKHVRDHKENFKIRIFPDFVKESFDIKD